MRFPFDSARRLTEGVKESFGINVPAFQASILFVSRNHALMRVATYFRRFAPGLLPSRSKHKIGSDFHASLEEAEVSRPGREAGIENGHDLERRRCGREIVRTVILSQLQRGAARQCDKDDKVHRVYTGALHVIPVVQ